MYSHYLTEKNLKEFKTEFSNLPNKYKIDKNINYEDFNEKIEYIKFLIIKLKRCNLLNKVNDGTHKKIGQSNKVI